MKILHVRARDGAALDILKHFPRKKGIARIVFNQKNAGCMWKWLRSLGRFLQHTIRSDNAIKLYPFFCAYVIIVALVCINREQGNTV